MVFGLIFHKKEGYVNPLFCAQSYLKFFYCSKLIEFTQIKKHGLKTALFYFILDLFFIHEFLDFIYTAHKLGGEDDGGIFFDAYFRHGLQIPQL